MKKCTAAVGGVLQRLEEQGLVEAVWESNVKRRRLTWRLAGVKEVVQDVAGLEPGDVAGATGLAAGG